jgi:ribonuclease HI
MNSIDVFVAVFGDYNPGPHTCACIVRYRSGTTYTRTASLGHTTTPKAWALALQHAIDAIPPWDSATIHLRDQALVRCVARGLEYPTDFEPSRRTVEEIHRRGLSVAWVDRDNEHAKKASEYARGVA